MHTFNGYTIEGFGVSQLRVASNITLYDSDGILQQLIGYSPGWAIETSNGLTATYVTIDPEDPGNFVDRHILKVPKVGLLLSDFVRIFCLDPTTMMPFDPNRISMFPQAVQVDPSFLYPSEVMADLEEALGPNISLTIYHIIKEAQILAELNQDEKYRGVIPKFKGLYLLVTKGQGQEIVVPLLMLERVNSRGTNLYSYFFDEVFGDNSADSRKVKVVNVLRGLQSISRTLDYISTESNQIIHRDFKLANILVRESGEYVLADFGSSLKKLITARHSWGTLRLMSPEQIRFALSEDPVIDGKVDVYAFGIALIELLTGSNSCINSYKVESLIGEDGDSHIDHNAVIANIIDMSLPTFVLDEFCKQVCAFLGVNREVAERLADFVDRATRKIATERNITNAFLVDSLIKILNGENVALPEED